MNKFPMIPRGPIEVEPLDVWRAHRGESMRDLGREALAEALAEAGLDLGAYDERIAKWLGEIDLSAAVTVASWIVRAHAAGGDAR
jgi:hypothetical protein